MRRAFFKKSEVGKQNTTECHSAELIGYQTPSLLQKNCTVSIRHQPKQVVVGFLLHYWLDNPSLVCLFP